MKQELLELTNACIICQRNKNSKEYGEAFDTSKQINVPFEHIGIDSVGPLKISSDGQGVEYTHILTIIDYGTRIVELVPLSSLNSAEISRKFDEVWLCRYPRPLIVTGDQAFNNKEFKRLLDSYGIKATFSTAHNPQSNGVVERMHYYLNNCLRCSENENWHEVLPSISWSIRSSYHNSIDTTPDEMVFGRNMIINKEVDKKNILERAIVKTKAVKAKDQLKQNKKKIPWNYKAGQKAFIRCTNPGKLDAKFDGPYEITKVNKNFTVVIEIDGRKKTYNIRKLKPAKKVIEGGQNVVTQTTNEDLDKEIESDAHKLHELNNLNYASRLHNYSYKEIINSNMLNQSMHRLMHNTKYVYNTV